MIICCSLKILLKSLSTWIDSVLSDVTGHLFAELQDKELEVASQLVGVNLRDAEAVAGVVLETQILKLKRTLDQNGPMMASRQKSDLGLHICWRSNSLLPRSTR
jgi:hypothetical protein